MVYNNRKLWRLDVDWEGSEALVENSEGTSLYSAKLVADGGAVLAERFGAVDKVLVAVHSVSACTYLLIVLSISFGLITPKVNQTFTFLPSFLFVIFL